MTIDRRTLLGLAAAGLAGLTASAARATDLADALAEIERAHGGQIGVFASEAASGPSFDWRADTLFPMESTFKAPLAALALSRVQSGVDTLQTVLRYNRADLMPVSPITEAHVAEGGLTIAVLVSAILERSDNAAANILLAHVGGPSALTGFLRKIGDTVTTIRRGEVMGAPEAGGNTTSPRAFSETMLRLATGQVLDSALRNRFVDGMVRNQHGSVRLRAAFPTDWPAADRTGTGDGICNDAALVWPPGRAPITLSVFYHAPGMELPAQEAVLRDVGQRIASRFS